MNCVANEKKGKSLLGRWLIPLTCLLVLLACASSAYPEVSTAYTHKWCSPGTGNGQSKGPLVLLLIPRPMSMLPISKITRSRSSEAQDHFGEVYYEARDPDDLSSLFRKDTSPFLPNCIWIATIFSLFPTGIYSLRGDSALLCTDSMILRNWRTK
jgi:hypothetical protein